MNSCAELNETRITMYNVSKDVLKIFLLFCCHVTQKISIMDVKINILFISPSQLLLNNGK
jgi:hypothetical protein